MLTISSLINLKDPIPRNRQSGIYKLTCGICDAQYICQTGQAIAVRLSEHRTAFNTQKAADSAMAEHSLREDHSFNNVSGKMLRVCCRGPIINKYEEVETIATYQTIGNKLQNNLTATYVTPIVRYFYNFYLTNSC